MDKALLAVLPLVGGYIFAKEWIVTKYFVQREDGHRLYFRAAFYAAFLFAVAFLLRIIFLDYIDSFQHFELELLGLSDSLGENTMKHDDAMLLLVSLYAFVLGSFLWLPFSLPFVSPYFSFLFPFEWRKKLLEDAVCDNEMEQLISTAVRRAIPVAATMENNKVYIGLVSATPLPTSKTKTLSLLPLVSGYRDSNTGSLTLTTPYDGIYKNLADIAPHLEIDDFAMVLPMDKIQSLNLFDLNVYAAFQKLNSIVSSKKAKKAPKRRR